MCHEEAPSNTSQLAGVVIATGIVVVGFLLALPPLSWSERIVCLVLGLMGGLGLGRLHLGSHPKQAVVFVIGAVLVFLLPVALFRGSYPFGSLVALLAMGWLGGPYRTLRELLRRSGSDSDQPRESDSDGV